MGYMENGLMKKTINFGKVPNNEILNGTIKEVYKIAYTNTYRMIFSLDDGKEVGKNLLLLI